MSCRISFAFKWLPQLGSLQEVEERVGDLEAEHDYLIEAEASLHSTSSKEQVFLRGSAFQRLVQEWLESCRLRPDPGPCRGRLPRYYFLPRCHLVQWQSFFFQTLI